MFTIKFERLNLPDDNHLPEGTIALEKHYVISFFETKHFTVYQSDQRTTINFDGPESYETIGISNHTADFNHCWIENQYGKTIAHYGAFGLEKGG